MVQTLFTLAALLATMLFVFNQQRNIRHAEATMVRNEIVSQATAVAVDRLEEIGAMAFDEATKGDTRLTQAAALTSATVFTADAPPIDDIDDFDGAHVRHFRVAWKDTLWFDVHTEVVYAQESDPGEAVSGSSIRTKYKKATVHVISTDPLVADTITLSQSFSCGSKCDW